MISQPITLLTDPLPIGLHRILEPAKSVGRAVKRVFPQRAFSYSPYRGHFSVTRSAVEGLKAIGVPVRYNPTRVEDVSSTVIVLSSLGALRQAISLKREGKIRRLLAGPNLVVFPSLARKLISAPEVDVCIVPSNWVIGLYTEDCPELAGRCLAWPAGVDTTFWTPRGMPPSKKALLYLKPATTPRANVSEYVSILRDRGFGIQRLEHGKFNQTEYREHLRSNSLLVGFSGSESQGLAWAEAWACDVPTLLWSQESNQYRGRFFESSTAPYLSVATGRFFRDRREFESELDALEKNRTSFQPRQWVLEEMSDAASARRLFSLAVERGVPVPLSP